MGQRKEDEILRRDKNEARQCGCGKIGCDGEQFGIDDAISPMKMLAIAVLYCAMVSVALVLAWLI